MIKDIPGVKVCFDTNHYTKGTTGHFVETVGERIGTIHASDFDFVNECHWLPTQGDIPVSYTHLDVYKRQGLSTVGSKRDI